MRTAFYLGALVASLACATGCGAAAGEARPPEMAAAAGATHARVVEWEGRWLEELGVTDPRIALRLRTRPSAEARQRASGDAVIRGADVLLLDGAIDPFAFDERAKRLKALREQLATAPDDGTAETRDERTLLARMLDAEDLRLAEERVVPESASEHVRAIVAAWGRPLSTAEVDARETEVSRGLLGVIAGVTAGRLSRPRILELEDALDPLERLAVPEGYPEATKLITSLRVALGTAPTTGAVHEATPAIALELRAYLGVHEDRDALAARLEDAELTLRRDAKAALVRIGDRMADDVLTTAAAHVQNEAKCAARESTSLARAVEAATERGLTCGVLALGRVPAGSIERIVAEVALHDDVAIALWALALEKGATDLDVTRTEHPLLASVPHDRQERLVRAALVLPMRAIAAGLAVAIVDADGVDARAARAERWLAFGDAPFDVVTAALAAKHE